MIPKPYIAEWQNNAPWNRFYQVEQDLIICRILVELFNDDYLKNELSFRGGTALHKLFLSPAPRYSEDIDLVQINPGPIKPIMDRIAKVIRFFEEERKTENRGHGIKALYRFTSEYEEIRMRLKIEINCKEHFCIMGFIETPFEVSNNWFSGKSELKTYHINELLGSKLRALYQRSKGRDLFDLDYARRNLSINYAEIIHCFKEYIRLSTGTRIPTKKEFLINIEEKRKDSTFIGDLEGLLRPEIQYDQEAAIAWLENELLETY